MKIKLSSIILIFLLTQRAFAVGIYDQQRVQNWIAEFPYVLTGHFIESGNTKTIFDKSYPGDGYRVKEFKINRIIKGSDVATEDILKIRVALDLFNKDEINYKKSQLEFRALRKECNKEKSMPHFQESDLSDKAHVCNLQEKVYFGYSLLLLEELAPFDFALSPDIEYFIVLEHPENGEYTFKKNAHSLLPLDKGLYIDEVLNELGK